jgi:hypothetical protein
MSSTLNVVREAIIPWKAMIPLTVIVSLISGLQSCVAGEIEDYRVKKLNSTIAAKSARCEVRSFDAKGNIAMTCGQHGQFIIEDSALALEHAVNHQPLTCTIYRGNPPNCTSIKTK